MQTAIECYGFRDPRQFDSKESVSKSTSGEFRRWGECWWLTFEGESVPFSDYRGLVYIHRLLSKPGEYVHCSVLSVLEREISPSQIEEEASNSGDELALDGCSRQEVLDQRALKEIHSQIQAINQELEKSESTGNFGLAEKLEEEKDQLLKQVKTHQFGHKRKVFANPNDKIRKAVSKSIREAIHKIWEFHPRLAEHLNEMIETGMSCAYRRAGSIHWRLQ